MKKKANKPSKPRDAASVIIYKEMYNKYYVLMGKRSIKSKFMPSIYVFPGGAVDNVDYQANKLFSLSTSINKNKMKIHKMYLNLDIVQLMLTIRPFRRPQR